MFVLASTVSVCRKTTDLRSRFRLLMLLLLLLFLLQKLADFVSALSFHWLFFHLVNTSERTTVCLPK